MEWLLDVEAVVNFFFNVFICIERVAGRCEDIHVDVISSYIARVLQLGDYLESRYIPVMICDAYPTC